MTYYKPKIGYVVKRYPRYSETFIVREILAHERAGLDIEIFAFELPTDTHFQDIISKVKAPLNYMPAPFEGIDSKEFWNAIEEASEKIPDLWASLKLARGEEAQTVYYSLIIARMVREKNLNHLHAHFATTPTSVARLAALFAGISYSFTTHAYDIYSDRAQLDSLRKKLLDAAAAITVSDYNVNYLRDQYGPTASNVKRIYNGLELKKYQYKIPSNRKPIIVSIGRLIEKKGFGVLIDACAILKERDHKFICQIIGAGPLEKDLLSKIKSLRLNTNVKLLGPLPQNEVMKYVRKAAVFPAPCIVGQDGNRDGLPTTLIEAAALGTPCVSTDVTGIPELIRDGETGLIVSQNNSTELANAIEKILLDPTLGVKLATRARNLVEKEFDINTNTKYIRDIFKEAITTMVDVSKRVS